MQGQTQRWSMRRIHTQITICHKMRAAHRGALAMRLVPRLAWGMQAINSLSPGFTQRQGICFRSSNGFTIIELMVVIAIVAILTALALPSFTPIMEKWRVRQSVEEMTATLYFARSEGIKRGGNVFMQKIPNSASCTLAPTNQDWGCGWTVFFDTNANGSQDAGEPTLQTSPAPARTNVTITGSTGGRIKIDRWGSFGSLGATSISLIPEGKSISDPASAVICVTSGGRLRRIDGTGTC